ncbi:MAG: tyrosine-type recombinase/integrase [Sphingomonas sp.]|uniref:tyrosine-type recombinase/integrase n=1 Tax=Sphingomonas sp. TaxID=28214 RepID=UPI0025CF3633|nr:integrase arm-type DNA-binding domain-containing protein [Sphingomonas sp.]MBQ1500357.1 tyrosine-type recombinase/integrase [Sphingomonas sp.]MBQ8104247.1 tyrosine-type recombinase/integrase [Afipia sp.]
MTLSVKEIEHARPSERNRKLWDEKGLYLLITPSGSRRWHFKYRFLGSEKKLSFGAYPEVTLKAARAKRDEARTMLAEDRDPSRERQAKKLAAKVEAENTFSSIAREFIEKRAADGIADTTKSKSEWLLSILEPRLGRMPVADITAPVLLAVLKEVQASGRRETARRLRAFASRVIDYAVITGRAQHNPAKALQRALITPTVRHHPAIIDPEKLGGLLHAIDAYPGYPSTIAALRLSPHLFQRPGEIRSMRWDELDLDRARWIIPEGRTKMRRAHEVPLSRQALEIIRSMTPISGCSELVFPAFHSMRTPISENTVNGALRRLGYAGIMTAHGFRSTASLLLNESGNWPPDVIEHALAHQDKNAIRAIYNRTSYWNVRVEMMQAWSDQLDALKKQAAGLPEGPKSEAPKRPPAEPRKAPTRTRTTADPAGRT